MRSFPLGSISRTSQKIGQVHESAALAAELRAPQRKLIQHILNHLQGAGHAFEFLYRAAFRTVQWQPGCPCQRMKSIHVSCENVAE